MRYVLLLATFVCVTTILAGCTTGYRGPAAEVAPAATPSPSLVYSGK